MAFLAWLIAKKGRCVTSMRKIVVRALHKSAPLCDKIMKQEQLKCGNRNFLEDIWTLRSSDSIAKLIWKECVLYTRVEHIAPRSLLYILGESWKCDHLVEKMVIELLVCIFATTVNSKRVPHCHMDTDQASRL